LRLCGKRCLIVGGASGIGRAAAERFRAERAAVVVTDLEDRGDAAVIRADAADAAAVDRMFAEAVERLGGLEVLFHVAGASGRSHGDGPLHECSPEGWDWTLATNLRGTFLTNRAAIRHFLFQKQPGVILNTSSVLAFAHAPRHFDTAAYAAAKAGIIGLSRQAAARYAADRIRVNVLAPGLIDTPMAARAVHDPAIAAFLSGKQPLAGGPGCVADVADAAVFLCSDESRLITGAVLAVDGGWSVAAGPYDEVE
jgi:NAD(P)-dependent dehydrogenase (short-subunit alcohol dehydrogenase family)